VSHDLQIPNAFRKVRRRKELRLRNAIDRCVKLLAEDVHYPGLQVHRVQGTQGVWEAYVDIHNRVTFHWDGDVIVLRNNCNHDILDRNP